MDITKMAYIGVVVVYDRRFHPACQVGDLGLLFGSPTGLTALVESCPCGAGATYFNTSETRNRLAFTIALPLKSLLLQKSCEAVAAHSLSVDSESTWDQLNGSFPKQKDPNLDPQNAIHVVLVIRNPQHSAPNFGEPTNKDRSGAVI